MRKSEAPVARCSCRRLVFSLSLTCGLLLSSNAIAQQQSPTNQPATSLPAATTDNVSPDMVEQNKIPVVLQEVTVTATRTSEDLKVVPQAVTIVNEQSVQTRFARSTAFYLREQPGIFAPQVAATGSPIIRGSLGATRVLYMWNGIRLNNAGTRSGPSEGMNQIPDVAVSRMEVIRGPGSVQYGTDAIGGVINIMTPRAEGFQPKFKIGGALNGMYGTNDEGRTTNATMWFSSNRINFSAGGTTRDIGPYRTPAATQFNTGYGANGGYFDIGFMISPNQILRASWIQNRRGNVETYTQSKMNASGIPRVFNPFEIRGLSRIEYTHANFLRARNEMRLYAYDQYYDTNRDNTVENTRTISRTRQYTEQRMDGGGVQDAFWFGSHHLVTGFDFRREDLSSYKTLYTFTKSTGATAVSVPNGNVPPGTYDVTDAFTLAVLKLSPRMTASAGLRFESIKIHSNPRPEDALTPFTVDLLRLDKRWNTATWNVGLIYNIYGNWSLVTNVATAFRAPGFSDALNTGVPTYASGIASVPSPSVKPEHSITAEAGARYTSKRTEFSITAYTNQLSDVMNSVANGTIFVPGVGTVTAMVNGNIGSGYIRGVEAYGTVRFLTRWYLAANYTYTRGLDTVAFVPLRFIPPMNGTLTLHYSAPKERWWAEASMIAVDRLRHHSPQDETDAGFSRDPGYGSPSATNPPFRANFQLPGYLATNLRGGYRIWRDSRVTVELLADINNLFDVHYREPYAQQQLYAPGFGAALGGRIRF